MRHRQQLVATHALLHVGGENYKLNTRGHYSVYEGSDPLPFILLEDLIQVGCI